MTRSERFAIIDQTTKLLDLFPNLIENLESLGDSRAVGALLRGQTDIALARAFLIDQEAANANS